MVNRTFVTFIVYSLTIIAFYPSRLMVISSHLLNRNAETRNASSVTFAAFESYFFVVYNIEEMSGFIGSALASYLRSYCFNVVDLQDFLFFFFALREVDVLCRNRAL